MQTDDTSLSHQLYLHKTRKEQRFNLPKKGENKDLEINDGQNIH